MYRKVKYRLEQNWLSVDRDDMALETSSPIYSLAEGINEYAKAIQERCIDADVPARCTLWQYRYKKDGTPNHIVIVSNCGRTTV